MKYHRTFFAGLAFLVGTPPSAFAFVTIDWVDVGHAGNGADPTTGHGAVDYGYKIGKYEVTNAQYTEFLNAVDPNGTNLNDIYSPFMGSDVRGGIAFSGVAPVGSKYAIRSSMGDKPVNFVSWYDAARFTNWLHNGQGSGDTEDGAYTLTGNTDAIPRNVDALVWLPNLDEWYKAAYFDPTKDGTGGYWLYPTQSDTVPTVATANSEGEVSNPGANVSNYSNGADWNSLSGNLTTVGSAGAKNYFGTADMAGNVWEWDDVVINDSSRGIRGGSWDNSEFPMRSSFFTDNSVLSEFSALGFRVASIPEPSSIFLAIFAVGVRLVRRRR